MKRVNISANTEHGKHGRRRSLGSRALSLMLALSMALSVIVFPNITASAGWDEGGTGIPAGGAGTINTMFEHWIGYRKVQTGTDSSGNPIYTYYKWPCIRWKSDINNSDFTGSWGSEGNSALNISVNGGTLNIGDTVRFKWCQANAGYAYDYGSNAATNGSFTVTNSNLITDYSASNGNGYWKYGGSMSAFKQGVDDWHAEKYPWTIATAYFKAAHAGTVSLRLTVDTYYIHDSKLGGAIDTKLGTANITVSYTINPLSNSITGIGDKTLTYGDTNVATGASANTSVSYSGYDTNVIKIEDHKISAVGAGSTTVTVKAAASGDYGDAPERTFKVTVNKKQAAISGYGNKTLTYGDSTPVGATTNSGATLQYSSSNKNVAVVENGKVVSKGAGTATITITSPETTNWTSDTKTFNVTVNKAQGQVSNYKDMDIIYGQEISLGASGNNTDSNGGLQYSTSDPDYVTVNGSGYIKGVDVGEAYITITSPETANWKKDEHTVHVTVDKAPAGIHTSDMTVPYNGSKNMNATADSGSTFEFKSNNTDLFDVDKYRGEIL